MAVGVEVGRGVGMGATRLMNSTIWQIRVVLRLLGDPQGGEETGKRRLRTNGRWSKTRTLSAMITAGTLPPLAHLAHLAHIAHLAHLCQTKALMWRRSRVSGEEEEMAVGMGGATAVEAVTTVTVTAAAVVAPTLPLLPLLPPLLPPLLLLLLLLGPVENIRLHSLRLFLLLLLLLLLLMMMMMLSKPK